MSFLVVALLSVLWLGFFLPSLLQARRTSSPYASATTFQDSLRRLGEVPYPQQPGTQQTHRRVSRQAMIAARRRDILAVLSAAVIAGALLAVAFGGWAVWAVPPPVVALAAYVALLRRDAVRRSARRAKVRSLEPATLPGPSHVGAPVADGAAFVAQEPAAEEPGIVPSVRRRSAAQPPERMAG